MSKEDSYKQLCEDLLRHITKEGFEFVRRFQALESETPANRPDAPTKPQQPKAPLPGSGATASLDVSSAVKRTNALVNPPPEKEEEEAPF